MLVNVHEDETRIALTENNLLVDLHIEQTTRERRVGNIYCGTVVKINPAFQAAFIDYGESRNGFLSVSDLSPALLKAAKAQRGRARIQSWCSHTPTGRTGSARRRTSSGRACSSTRIR